VSDPLHLRRDPFSRISSPEHGTQQLPDGPEVALEAHTRAGERSTADGSQGLGRTDRNDDQQRLAGANDTERDHILIRTKANSLDVRAGFAESTEQPSSTMEPDSCSPLTCSFSPLFFGR